MSINALTNAAVARRPDFQPEGAVPTNLTEMPARRWQRLCRSRPHPQRRWEERQRLQRLPSRQAPQHSVATLTTYIPTEVLTLYVSAIAALGPLTVKIGVRDLQIGRWLPFWCFFIATPLIVWVAFASKIKAGGKTIPLHPSKWPLWEMTAATIAYVAWTFALPATPFAQESWYSSGLASFLILVVSAGLGIIAPLMRRELPS